jgi:tetratricopeptide (TPR) repeat protein
MVNGRRDPGGAVHFLTGRDPDAFLNRTKSPATIDSPEWSPDSFDSPKVSFDGVVPSERSVNAALVDNLPVVDEIRDSALSTEEIASQEVIDLTGRDDQDEDHYDHGTEECEDEKMSKQGHEEPHHESKGNERHNEENTSWSLFDWFLNSDATLTQRSEALSKEQKQVGNKDLESRTRSETRNQGESLSMVEDQVPVSEISVFIKSKRGPPPSPKPDVLTLLHSDAEPIFVSDEFNVNTILSEDMHSTLASIPQKSTQSVQQSEVRDSNFDDNTASHVSPVVLPIAQVSVPLLDEDSSKSGSELKKSADTDIEPTLKTALFSDELRCVEAVLATSENNASIHEHLDQDASPALEEPLDSKLCPKQEENGVESKGKFESTFCSCFCFSSPFDDDMTDAVNELLMNDMDEELAEPVYKQADSRKNTQSESDINMNELLVEVPVQQDSLLKAAMEKKNSVEIIDTMSGSTEHKRDSSIKDEIDEKEDICTSDLASVPSVQDDLITHGPIRDEDLGTKDDFTNANSANLVEDNAKKMKIKNLARSLEEACSISLRTDSIMSSKHEGDINERRRRTIKDLRAAISTFGRYDLRCANISVELGNLLDQANEYEHAIKLYRDAITIYSAKLGDDNSTTLNAKVRLGEIFEHSGQYDDAIHTYYLVTVMRRGLRGERDPSVGDGLVHLAQALRKKGEYSLAIKEMKRALKIYRESLGDSHEKVASTVDQIASMYVTFGDVEKAAAILEEVVKLKAATMGMQSKAVAITLGHLATAYECSEKFPDAMKSLKKAYKIYTETSGYSSEEATTTLYRMANLYEGMNDHSRAAVAYLGVLRGRKMQYGSDHLVVGETYFRLGHSLRETKQYEKALKCLKEALPIFVGQGLEMNDVETVADIMHEMGLLNHDKAQLNDAARIFKQELSVRRKIGQPEYPFIARCLKCMGVVEAELGNHTKALKFLVEALAIFQDHGDQGPGCAEILVQTGIVFDAVRKKERALEALTEAVRILEEREDIADDNPMLRKANLKIEEIQNRRAVASGRRLIARRLSSK